MYCTVLPRASWTSLFQYHESVGDRVVRGVLVGVRVVGVLVVGVLGVLGCVVVPSTRFPTGPTGVSNAGVGLD